MLSQVDGAWSKVRRHKSAKVWQIKSLSGSWEQIAPMHASSHLPFSLSSPYIPPPLFAFFHCSLHFTLFTSIPPPCLFFSSFCINAIISECSTFPSFVLRFLPHVSLFFSILRINTLLFIRVSFFSFFFALLQPLLRTITLRVFLFFFTLPSELLQPTLSNARCLPMFTFLLLPLFFSIIASNVSFLLASFSFLNYRYNDPTNVLSPFLPSSSLSLAKIPDEKY